MEVFRGNVQTRLEKMHAGVVDATLLACAGLDRLGIAQAITERMSIDVMLPAIGQGVLALQVRADDGHAAAIVAPIHHEETATAVAAERSLLSTLGGSCRTPVGGHAWVSDGKIFLRGLVGHPDGSKILSEQGEASVGDAHSLGARVGQKLLHAGADRILAGF